jgi:putative flippase GtrA
MRKVHFKKTETSKAPQTARLPLADKRQLLPFLLCGLTATGVNVVSRFFFSMVLPFEFAILLAGMLGLFASYLLNRAFVFMPEARARRAEFLRFTLVNLAAVAQIWLVSMLFARVILPAANWSWHTETVAHLIGVCIPVVTSYLGYRHYSFRRAPHRL